jgi:hypothetical protein
LVVVVTVVVTFEMGVALGTPGVTTTGRLVALVKGVGRTGCKLAGFVARESARITRRGTAEVPGVGAVGWARTSAARMHRSMESWDKVFKVVIL